MILRVLLVVAIGLKLAGVAEAKYYDGLVVLRPDYKNLPVLVNCSENNFVTKQELLNAVKLRLMANNITPLDWKAGSGEWLYVNFLSLDKGSPFTIDIYLQKNKEVYFKDTFFLGAYVTPSQDSYVSIGASSGKSFIIENLNDLLDAFLIDYLETNMKFRKDLEEYKNNQARQKLIKQLDERDKSSE